MARIENRRARAPGVSAADLFNTMNAADSDNDNKTRGFVLVGKAGG